MKIVIPFLILFCSLSSAALSQNSYILTDTVYAGKLLKESREIFSRRQFDSALVKADSALLIFEEILGKESKEVANALILKSYILHNQLKRDQAIAAAEKALAIRLKLFGELHIETARGYERIARIHSNGHRDAKAIPYYEKSINIRRKVLVEEDLELAWSYFLCGSVYRRQFQADKALIYLNKALDIRIKKLGEEHELVAVIYKVIGDNYYWGMNDLSTALKYFEKAKAIYLKKDRFENPQASEFFRHLTDVYIVIEDYDNALVSANQSFKIDKSDYPYTWSEALLSLALVYSMKGDCTKAFDLVRQGIEETPVTFNNMDGRGNIAFFYLVATNCYSANEDYDKEIENFQRTIDLMQARDGENQWIAESYSGLGVAYQKKGDNQKAIMNSQKALPIYAKMYDSTSVFMASGYNALAECYEIGGLYDSAWFYRQKAMNCYIDKGLSNMSRTHKSFAQLAEKKKDFITAQTHFEKALSLLHYKDLKELDKAISMLDLINILEAKANFERRWYLATGNINHLKASAETYRQAFAALKYQNSLFHTEGAKADQKRKRYALYEGAIQTILLLKSQQGSKDAFSLSEESKAALLQSQLKETDALRFANIPDSLLEREKNLRLRITAYEKGRQERMNEGKNETDSFNLVLSSRADSLRTLYANLKQTFEKNYPNYYRLKYDFKTVDVGEVQQNLLSKEQTLLSYFVGDSSVYAFVVRADTFTIFDFKKDFPLEQWIKQLRDGIYGYHTASVKTEKLYEAKADSFAIAAFQLHQKLIAPLSQLLTQEVVIVPDGVLGYVPFDVLLTEKPKDALKFEQHHYFGKNHIISYNYSATLWQEMQNKKHKIEPKKNFIGFAPYYNGDTTLLSRLFSHDLAMRKGLDSLKYSGEEVFKAQKLMQGDAVLDKKATKQTFESIVGDYRIVHLATHGKANDKIGDYCFLAFTEQKDSLQNELLYVRDIYNLTLNADLVVLSACETGIGELKRGEGIVSLARAFAYAGAKSIVTTLWSVNDKSTMHIMEGFYRQLRKGQPKDYALWKSKMDYLQKAKSETAHPFFWSAFVPVGDMRSVKK